MQNSVRMNIIFLLSNPFKVIHAVVTVITVLVKGALSGLLAGVAYKLLSKRNRYLGVLAAAVVAPLVNTGIFLLGCLVFFLDTVTQGAAAGGMSVAAYLITVFVGLNFVFELLANVVLSPALLRLLNLRKK